MVAVPEIGSFNLLKLQCLYTEAVQYFPEDMQDIVDMMMEKEIRLHAPLEEIELLLQE